MDLSNSQSLQYYSTNKQRERERERERQTETERDRDRDTETDRQTEQQQQQQQERSKAKKLRRFGSNTSVRTAAKQPIITLKREGDTYSWGWGGGVGWGGGIIRLFISKVSSSSVFLYLIRSGT